MKRTIMIHENTILKTEDWAPETGVTSGATEGLLVPASLGPAFVLLYDRNMGISYPERMLQPFTITKKTISKICIPLFPLC